MTQKLKCLYHKVKVMSSNLIATHGPWDSATHSVYSSVLGRNVSTAGNVEDPGSHEMSQRATPGKHKYKKHS